MEKKKCIHKINMKGHGDPWCVLFRKVADCDLCFGAASGTNHRKIKALGDLHAESDKRDRFIRIYKQAESRCHRVGQKPRAIKIAGPLRDAAGSKTVMGRSKGMMEQLCTAYGGTSEGVLQLQRIDSMRAELQEMAAQHGYKETLVRLIGRPGVTLRHDEFVIDEKEWVSPFTEGELVRWNDQLARVIKITGPIVKIKLQSRHSVNHLDVMDWDIKKRSIKKWVVKCWRKLWQKA